jgi:hypothetical protein
LIIALLVTQQDVLHVKLSIFLMMVHANRA